MLDVRAYGAPVIISSMLVLPFMILEWINPGTHSGFPVALFALMWLLALVFTFCVAQIARGARGGRRAARVVVAAAVAGLLIVLVLDQMPCFLGVPNCD